MKTDELLAEVRRVGAELAVINGKLKASPPGAISPELKAVIRTRAAEIKARLLALTPQPECMIEATLAHAREPESTFRAVEFPPCPVCGSVRYWLASGGRVLCGTKQCASARRFQLIALEFHPVH